MVVIASEGGLGAVYILSKEILKDYTIVELDPDNSGMVKKQNRKLPDNRLDELHDLDQKVMGFVEPHHLNGTKTGKSEYMLYSINIEQDWKPYDH